MAACTFTDRHRAGLGCSDRWGLNVGACEAFVIAMQTPGVAGVAPERTEREGHWVLRSPRRVVCATSWLEAGSGGSFERGLNKSVNSCLIVAHVPRVVGVAPE